MTCAHEKVYSGERHWTAVPQWFWICAVCHEVGKDSQKEPPLIDFDRFCDLLAVVDPEGAAAMRRIRDRMRR